MAPKDDVSTLRQKLDRGQAPRAGGERSLLRALRIALARVSRDQLGLSLDVIGATRTAAPQDDLAGFLPDDSLLILLDGPDGQSGALALDTRLVTAMIQQQTMGSVSPGLAGDRVFADTDAALCAPTVSAMLTAAADLAEAPEDRLCLTGYAFGARAEDGKSLALALQGDGFHVFDLKLDVQSGAAQAGMVVILPVRNLPKDDGTGTAQSSGTTLQDVALTASVRLNAVLCRLNVSLDDLAALKQGDLLMLPGCRLDRTELLSMSGQRVGSGRLGRAEGVRALRVNETSLPNPSFALSEPGSAVENQHRSDVARPVIDAVPANNVPKRPGEEKETLDQMNPDEAMARITELAGLKPDDWL